MKKLLFLLGGFMLFAPFLQAQTPRKPVEIEADGGDPIGMMLASALRDEIVKSPRYVLVSSTGGKSLSPAPWIIHLVTLDPDKSGNLTAAAVTITQGIIYWGSTFAYVEHKKCNNAQHQSLPYSTRTSARAIRFGGSCSQSPQQLR